MVELDRDKGILGRTLTQHAAESLESPAVVELARQLVRADLLGSAVYLREYDLGRSLSRETFARVLGRDCLLLGLVASLWSRIETQAFPKGQLSPGFGDRLASLLQVDWWRDQAAKAVLADPKLLDEPELWHEDLLEHVRRAGVYRSPGLLLAFRERSSHFTGSDLRSGLVADQAVARLLRRSLLHLVGSLLATPSRPRRHRPSRSSAPDTPPPPPPRSLGQILDEGGSPPPSPPHDPS